MSDTDTPERFAHGSNNVDEYECPALVAGMDPGYNKVMLDVTRIYDDAVQSLTGEVSGTVSADIAEDAWDWVIDHFESRMSDAKQGNGRQYYAERHRIAVNIALRVFE